MCGAEHCENSKVFALMPANDGKIIGQLLVYFKKKGTTKNVGSLNRSKQGLIFLLVVLISGFER
jgi:hypothetical protein